MFPVLNDKLIGFQVDKQVHVGVYCDNKNGVTLLSVGFSWFSEFRLSYSSANP